jgi:hypothetical protein
MADKKISQLTALAAANLAPSTDVLAIVDTSATETKKIVAQDLINGVLNVASAVGIGTTSPAVKLHVQGSAGQIMRVTDGTTGASIYSGGGLFGFNNQTGEDGMFGSTASHFLYFATNGTEKLRLDSSGNLGLGVTPNVWLSSFRAIQLGQGSSLWGAATGNNAGFDSNVYVNTSGGSIYVGSTFATRYQQSDGTHKWFIAPSGTAGNTISFTQAMTLDASGNLGVGTTGPGTRLDVRGPMYVPAANFKAVAQLYSTDSQATGNGAGITLGGVFTGTDVTSFAQIAGIKENSTDNNYAGALVLYSRPNGDTLAERARITAGGYFKASNDGTYVSSTGTYHELRSTTNNSRTVSIHSAASNGTQYGLLISTANDQADATRYFLSCEGGGVERATIRSNGGLANYSANDVNLASDERLKKDISPLNTAWDKVKDIEVVNYRYKDCNEGDPLLYGVIAQQVQPIVPELVVVTREATETDPEYYGIREQPMYWLAIKALQEAMARIESLEADVAALKGAK